MSLLDDFADPILQELHRLDTATQKMRAQRNQYRLQLKQVNRAQRMLKLEHKALKAKYDDLIAGNYIRAGAWSYQVETLEAEVRARDDARTEGYLAGMAEAYRLVALGI